jgi:cellobiose phosphorylase
MWQLLQLVNPVNHGNNEEDMLEYKVEPYVIAADVYAVEGQVGRGGWTWYTGSAGWMYQLIIEYVFGLRRQADRLLFDPCLPPHWDQVVIHYQFGTSLYHITISQETDHADGSEVTVDGALQDEGHVALVDDGQEHEVHVRSSVLQKA